MKDEEPFSTLFLHRLKTFLYAEQQPPADPTKSQQLRVGLIGGDIPIFPPLAAILCTGLGGIGWFGTSNRQRYLPLILPAMDGVDKSWFLVTIRMAISSFLFFGSRRMVKRCRIELNQAGTSPNFKPVTKVCATGPFAYTRNMMYACLIVGLPISLSIACDSAWFLYSAIGLTVYLDRIVIPTEEQFLTKVMGESYKDYCQRVPRWFGPVRPIRSPTSIEKSQ